MYEGSLDGADLNPFRVIIFRSTFRGSSGLKNGEKLFSVIIVMGKLFHVVLCCRWGACSELEILPSVITKGNLS